MSFYRYAGLVVATVTVGCSFNTTRHLVAVGDEVRVNVAVTAAMPAGWQTTAFADSAWTTQLTAFVPTMGDVAMPADVAVRRTFDIGADYAAFDKLTLDFKPGASFDVYLNGQSFGSSTATAAARRP